jgi:uncharacterized FlaG/YvyC family protein
MDGSQRVNRIKIISPVTQPTMTSWAKWTPRMIREIPIKRMIRIRRYLNHLFSVLNAMYPHRLEAF